MADKHDDNGIEQPNERPVGEPGGPPEPSPSPSADEGPAADGREPPALPVEPSEEAEAPSGVRALDICPNCGAPMRGPNTLVCMKCGFDLKQLKVIKTKLGEVAEEEDEKRDDRDPLVERGFGDPWLPLGLAGAAVIVLAVGYLAGYTGLFDMLALGEGELPATTVPWKIRLLGLLQLPILLAIGTACGIATVAVGAWIFGNRLGDAPLATARVLGIVALARLASFIDVTNHAWEGMLEAVAQAAAFFILCLPFLRVRPRDAGTLTGLMVLAVILLYTLSRLVTWALDSLP